MSVSKVKSTLLRPRTFVIMLTFCAILAAGIIFRQSPLRIFPLFISLFIMMFQADANRYAYLAGGLNSILYGLVYIYIGIYASAASALLFSFPVQILTFLNWKKHSYGQSVHFKKMTAKQRIAVTAAFIAVWIGLFTILNLMGSQYAFLDNTSSLISILVSVLTMLAYIEYSYLWLLSSTLSFILNIQVALDNPSHITYVIYSLYSGACVIRAFINVHKLYKKQQRENIEAAESANV